MDKVVITGYEFEVPLASDEQEKVYEAIAGGYTEADAGHRLYTAFSPNGGHLFILADSPVNPQPNGEIMGAEVDIIVPGIETVRPEKSPYTDTTDKGNGWKKIYDATHDPGCGCHACEQELG